MELKISNQTRMNIGSKGKFLITEVNYDTLDVLANWILDNRPRFNKFEILINSPGGKPSPVCYFKSCLRMLDNKVRIRGVAFGQCGSAAMALMQCCDERIAVKNCGFFIHHMHTTVEFHRGMKDRDRYLRAELESSRGVEEDLITLQCQRTGMTRKQWLKLAEQGENVVTPILPEAALKLGLVDKIVDRYPIF